MSKARASVQRSSRVRQNAGRPHSGECGYASLTRRDVANRRAWIVKLVEKLPEATVVEHGTHLSLEVRGKRFGWYLEAHHGDGRLALNCKASPSASDSLVTAAPDRFHVPKHVGHHGWVGIWLDLPRTDWPEVEAVLAEAYRMTAPKSLVARLHDSTR